MPNTIDIPTEDYTNLLAKSGLTEESARIISNTFGHFVTKKDLTSANRKLLLDVALIVGGIMVAAVSTLIAVLN